MRKTAVGVALLGVLLGASMLGCQSTGELGEGEDVLFQYSTLGSLMAGVYDGDMTYAQLKQHGDFGLGTFNTLDGEMIEVEHQVYQIRADGVAYPVDDEMKTPFAVVTYFEPDQTVEVADLMDYAHFKTYLDGLLPTENIPYAIRLTGTFAYVQTRSVPEQAEPYPPLLEVMETQPTFEFREVEGVMLGFRLPSYMAQANAPGYHFHFLTADKKAGGHVLEFQLEGIAAEIDATDEWYTVLPGDDAFYEVDISDDEYQ
jgi:acetolactate decarboxylase